MVHLLSCHDGKTHRHGNKYYLIGGDSIEYGYDDDEIIIRDAEVIAVL